MKHLGPFRHSKVAPCINYLANEGQRKEETFPGTEYLGPHLRECNGDDNDTKSINDGIHCRHAEPSDILCFSVLNHLRGRFAAWRLWSLPEAKQCDTDHRCHVFISW